MLMLLSVHVTSVLFLVQFNNFTLTVGFYWSLTLVARSYALLIESCRPHTAYLGNRAEQEGYELQTSFSMVQECILVFYTDYSAMYTDPMPACSLSP